MIRRLAAAGGVVVASGGVSMLSVLSGVVVFGTFILSGVALYLSMRSSSATDHERINIDKEKYATQKVNEAKALWFVREQELIASLGEKARENTRLQGRVDQLTDQLYGRRVPDGR